MCQGSIKTLYFPENLSTKFHPDYFFPLLKSYYCNLTLFVLLVCVIISFSLLFCFSVVSLYFNIQIVMTTKAGNKKNPSPYISGCKQATNTQLLWDDIGNVLKKHLALASKLTEFWVLGCLILPFWCLTHEWQGCKTISSSIFFQEVRFLDSKVQSLRVSCLYTQNVSIVSATEKFSS